MANLFGYKNSEANDETNWSDLICINTFIDESDEVLEKMDCMLKVNNEVVDNEFGGTGLSISLNWSKIGLRRPSEWLKTGEVELCSVRWCAAFLSEFGGSWAHTDSLYRCQMEMMEDLFSSCSRSIRALDLVTFPVKGARILISHIQSFGPIFARISQVLFFYFFS